MIILDNFDLQDIEIFGVLRGAPSEGHPTRISLVHDDSGFNKGFIKAHEIFEPDLIFRILYGEISMPKIRELVKSSL